MRFILLFIFCSLPLPVSILYSQVAIPNDTIQKTIVWFPSGFLTNTKGVQLSGHPISGTSLFGEAASFNGVNDAITLKEMPLKNLASFTVEMIFRPAKNAPFEQRVLHMGEVSRDRVLLEIRAVGEQWYFDGFAASGSHKKALADTTLTHPLGEWHHVAFVVEQNRLRTFVNHQLELEHPFNFSPILTGSSSIGMRLNHRSYFKGDIFQIRISPGVIPPEDFLSL